MNPFDSLYSGEGAIPWWLSGLGFVFVAGTIIALIMGIIFLYALLSGSYDKYKELGWIERIPVFLGFTPAVILVVFFIGKEILILQKGIIPEYTIHFSFVRNVLYYNIIAIEIGVIIAFIKKRTKWFRKILRYQIIASILGLMSADLVVTLCRHFMIK